MIPFCRKKTKEVEERRLRKKGRFRDKEGGGEQRGREGERERERERRRGAVLGYNMIRRIDVYHLSKANHEPNDRSCSFVACNWEQLLSR